jgi:hypothetical protein
MAVSAGTLTVVLAAGLGGCATQGEPVSERLDPNTATTVTILSRPVELFSQTTRGSNADPFAYLAPFETDRQGAHSLYLWVSAPQNGSGQLSQPQVLCNGQPLALQPVNADGSQGPAPAATLPQANPPPAGSASGSELSELNLSQAPYDSPVPWSQQWYFRLSADGLKCLAAAQGISLQTQTASGEAQVFTAERKNIAALDAFTQHY